MRGMQSFPIATLVTNGSIACARLAVTSPPAACPKKFVGCHSIVPPCTWLDVQAAAITSPPAEACHVLPLLQPRCTQTGTSVERQHASHTQLCCICQIKSEVYQLQLSLHMLLCCGLGVFTQLRGTIVHDLQHAPRRAMRHANTNRERVQHAKRQAPDQQKHCLPQPGVRVPCRTGRVLESRVQACTAST